MTMAYNWSLGTRTNRVLLFVNATLLLLLLPVSSTHNPLSLCYHGDSDCPKECPPGRSHVSLTSMLHLDFLDDMREHVLQAQEIISANAPFSSSVISLENTTTLHTSLNYWCCHTPEEQDVIVEIVKNLEWDILSLTIDETSCNIDHDGRTVYLLSVYDVASQRKLFSLVRRIETAMRAAGIDVHNPRHQPFHSTLARVVAQDYPVDRVVTLVQSAVPVYARAFNMTVMEVGGELIYASSTLSVS